MSIMSNLPDPYKKWLLTHELWGFFYLTWKFLDQRFSTIQSNEHLSRTYIVKIINYNYEETVRELFFKMAALIRTTFLGMAKVKVTCKYTQEVI